KGALDGETVAILGYGIQGRAQALNLRDSGVAVVVGNRPDAYRERAVADGFPTFDLADATRQGTIVVVLLPDEAQAAIWRDAIAPSLRPGRAVVFAHGFSVHYGLITPPKEVDLLLLAPRMPGQFVRERFEQGWGVPAFVAVGHDATGRAWTRLLGLAGALGVTPCAAPASSFAAETQLDHFSEHFTYPFIFRALELAFEALVEAGYAPEAALLELHGSGEMGQVLGAAAREGLFPMLAAHASPACQVGIARHWEEALGPEAEVRARMAGVLDRIHSGSFACWLVDQQAMGYPALQRWKADRSALLGEAERRLQALLRGPAASR